MKKFFFATAVVASLLLCSCSGLKVTEQMQAGIDLYTKAVENTEGKTSGKVSVTSVIKDNAIEFKNSESLIEYEYTVKDGAVLFTRTDYIDGVKDCEYVSDGITVKKKTEQSSEWEDVTEDNKIYLSPETNPLSTLSFFRVDSKHRIRTDYMTDIVYNSAPDENGCQSVKFTLKDSTVTDVLSYNKVKGIVRNSAGHTREYFIDESGNIAKVVISTAQQVFNNGKEGSYTTDITVVCE